MFVNQAFVLGRVGQDTKYQTFANGGEVAQFSIATTLKRRNPTTGETSEETSWIPVVVSNAKLIAFLKGYVSKGCLIYVRGRIRVRKWRDVQNMTRTATEIVAEDIQLISRPGDAGAQTQAPAVQQVQQVQQQEAEPDLPF